MSVHLSEEEQLENLKRWWAENGKSTIIMVVLAITGYFGWEGWKAQQIANIHEASASYQSLMQAVAVEPGQKLNEERLATVTHLVTELKDNHSSNLYASQAALFQAKFAVENRDFEQAANELQWVIDQNVDEALTLLSRSRLARVKIAQQDYSGALKVASDNDDNGFRATFAELRGDILLLQGKPNEARAAYGLALENLGPDDEGRHQFIQIKLNNLQTAAVSVVDGGSESNETQSDSTDAMAGDNS